MGRLVLSRPTHNALRCARQVARSSGKEHITVLRRHKYWARGVCTSIDPSQPPNDFSTIPFGPSGLPISDIATRNQRDAIKEAKPFSDFLTDTFNRQHDYLRISLTERCNLRCLYCMPEEGVPLSPQSHLLTTPEIYYLSALFVSQGVAKIRLTGGEPTIRRDILPLMQLIGSLRPNGLKELAITTNGISLHRKLDSMVESGLTGVNLSLDTLDPFQFQIMTRRKGFDAVMKSIDRMLEMNKHGAGIKLKVNCVVMRGLNEREIVPFVEMGREKDIEVRFIEYMPFDGNKWSQGKMIPYQEMLDIIREKYPGLRKVQDHKNDTSKTFEVPGFVGKVGFITSMTHNFCGTCNRLRITSDGSLKVCLFGNTEVSLRDLLRKGNKDQPIDESSFEALKQLEMDRHQGLLPEGTPLGWSERERELLEVIGAAVKRKKAGHAELGELENMKNRPMILIDSPLRSKKAPFLQSVRSSAAPAPWSNIPLHMLQHVSQGPSFVQRALLHTRKSRIQTAQGFAGTKLIPSQAWLFSKDAMDPAFKGAFELEKSRAFDETDVDEMLAVATGDDLAASKSRSQGGRYQQMTFTTTPRRTFPTIITYDAPLDRYELTHSPTILENYRQQVREQVDTHTLKEDEGYVFNLETKAFQPFSEMPHPPNIYMKLYKRLLNRRKAGYSQSFVDAFARKHFSYEDIPPPTEGTRHWRPEFLVAPSLKPPRFGSENRLRLKPDVARPELEVERLTAPGMHPRWDELYGPSSTDSLPKHSPKTNIDGDNHRDASDELYGPSSSDRLPKASSESNFDETDFDTFPLIKTRRPNFVLYPEGHRAWRPSFLLSTVSHSDEPIRAEPDVFKRARIRSFHTMATRTFKDAHLQPFSGPSAHKRTVRPYSTTTGSSATPPSSPSTSEATLTHLDASGAANMVSVSNKPHTVRRAVAIGRISFSNRDPATLIASNAIKKGDVLSIARIAGITAAKKTPEFIPLCHPIPLTSVVLDLDLVQPGDSPESVFGCMNVHATIECTGPTGVEMEALMGVWGALSTVYDMCKAVDKGMKIDSVKVVLKEGGRSGTLVDPEWHAENMRALEAEQSAASAQSSKSSQARLEQKFPEFAQEKDKHDPFAPAATGAGAGFISTAEAPPAGQHPRDSVVSKKPSDESTITTLLPGVLMIMVLFAGVEVLRSKRKPTPPSQLSASASADELSEGEKGISIEEIEQRAKEEKLRKEKEARHKIDEKTMANILKRKGRGVPSASDAAASAVGITKVSDEDREAMIAKREQQGAGERTNLEKAVLVGMLVVWPVAHIAWYLAQGRGGG